MFRKLGSKIKNLFKKKSDDEVKFKTRTFTKIWVSRCMWFSWICIFWCFILATLGKDQVAENLATALVMNIVGVMLGYLAKSFFETREEKLMDFKHMERNCNCNTDSEMDSPRFDTEDLSDLNDTNTEPDTPTTEQLDAIKVKFLERGNRYD